MITHTTPATTVTSTGPHVDYALELRAEVMKIVCGDESKHRGEIDRLEIGSGGGHDVVAAAETLRVGGTLSEEIGGSAQVRAARFDTHVKGRMNLHLHSDMTLLGGAMTETWAGAVMTLTGMSDNMTAGVGTRISTLDLWLIGLTGMEEKIATAAADLAFIELYVNHMEREYTAGSHNAGVALFSGAVFTTMATGFRQLVKVANGVRDLSPGGGGGGGGGAEGGTPSPPPPVPAVGTPGMLNDVDDVRRGDDVADVDDIRRVDDTGSVEDVRQVDDPPQDDMWSYRIPSIFANDPDDVDDVRRVDDTAGVEDVRRVDDTGTGGDVPRSVPDGDAPLEPPPRTPRAPEETPPDEVSQATVTRSRDPRAVEVPPDTPLETPPRAGEVPPEAPLETPSRTPRVPEDAPPEKPPRRRVGEVPPDAPTEVPPEKPPRRRVGEVPPDAPTEVPPEKPARGMPRPDETPPEVPPLTPEYYDKVARDQRKAEVIAVGQEYQKICHEIEGEDLTRYEMLEEIDKRLKGLLEETDPDNKARTDAIDRLRTLNESQRKELERLGKGGAPTRGDLLRSLDTPADTGDVVDTGGDAGRRAPTPPPAPEPPPAPVPTPRPVTEALPEDYRKAYGIPEDFDFDNEWKKFEEWRQKVVEKDAGGVAGDPNNDYVVMTLDGGRANILYLSKAYYDSAFPPHFRTHMLSDFMSGDQIRALGANPTPSQVRQAMVDYLDYQKTLLRVAGSEYADLEDIQHVEDLLKSFDANTHHIMQDALEDARAFADMEWKKLPEDVDAQGLADELNRMYEQAKADIEYKMTGPDRHTWEPIGKDQEENIRLHNRMKGYLQMRDNVAAGYDPVPAMDAAVERIRRQMSYGAGEGHELVTSIAVKQAADNKKTWASLLDSFRPSGIVPDVPDVPTTIPDDFNFADEWRQLNQRYSSSRPQSKMGFSGDPNNPRVLQTLEDGRTQVQELARAYYDQVLPPETRALTFNTLGDNPTPEQVRNLIEELIEEQRGMLSTWVNNPDTTDLKQLEDLLESFDANTHRIMQDAQETADAFSNMEWTKLPENTDTDKLLEIINKQIDAQREGMLEPLTPEEKTELGARIEYLENLRGSIEAGLEPTDGLDMARDYLTTRATRGETDQYASLKLGVLEWVSDYWIKLRDSTMPTDVDIEELIWQFSKDANWQRNSGEQGGFKKWMLGTSTEAATPLSQGRNELAQWSNEFVREYNIVVTTKHEYGDQSAKVRKWLDDKLAEIAERGGTMADIEDISASKMPADKEFLDVRRSILDGIKEAEESGDTRRVEELRSALEQFDNKMWSSITTYRRNSEAALTKPMVPLSPAYDRQKLAARLDEMMADAEAFQFKTQERMHGNIDDMQAQQDFVKSMYMISIVHQMQEAVANGHDPLNQLLDAMYGPKYHIKNSDWSKHSRDSLPKALVQLEALQELYDTLSRSMRDPKYHKFANADDITRALRRLPTYTDRAIIPRGVTTPEGVEAALAPLAADLTALENWEVLWYRTRLAENTRLAETMKATYPSSAFAEALSMEYRRLTELYGEEWMRRLGIAEDTDVRRIAGEGGLPSLPREINLDEMARLGGDPNASLGGNAQVLKRHQEKLWSKKARRWQEAQSRGWSNALEAWRRYAEGADLLGERPGAYDILSDMESLLEEVVLELGGANGTAAQLLDPHAVLDSYLLRGRRLYFDDDMLSVSEAVVDVFRSMVDRKMVHSSASASRTLEALGPHVVHYLRQMAVHAARTSPWSIQETDGKRRAGTERNRGGGNGAGNGSGGAGPITPAGALLPELLGEESWTATLEPDRVSWERPHDDEGDVAYQGRGAGEETDDDDDDPWAALRPSRNDGVPHSERNEEEQAILAGIPWARTTASAGTEELALAEVGDRGPTAALYFAATAPAVHAGQTETTPDTADMTTPAEEDSYRTRREALRPEGARWNDLVKPQEQPLPGFASRTTRSAFAEEPPTTTPAVDPANGEDEDDVLHGATSHTIPARDLAALTQLVLDTREACSLGVKLTLEAGAGHTPNVPETAIRWEGFAGRPRSFPWGGPWHGA